MIYIGFDISWPIKKEPNKNQKNYFCKEWLITKHKFIETQLSRSYNSFPIIGFRFSYYPHQDHAGPELTIYLLAHFFILGLRDSRHWYREKGRWFLPGEEEEVYRYDK